MTQPAFRPSLRRSPAERAILGAISDGARMDDLLRCPKWSVDDVSQTMTRFGLVAAEDGRIVRRRTIEDLLQLAKGSASPAVRSRAKQAADRLRALQEAIGAELAHTLEEAERTRQREAVDVWIDWLTDALGAARDERRRLRPRTAKKVT